MFIPKQKLEINARGLKLIAMITMLIDHIGAIILYNLMLEHQTNTTLENLYIIARMIGRLSFPLYCFLLAEGFHHTRSKSKYIKRLLLFAFISEIPYDLAFSNRMFDLTKNNVIFTLSLGFILMWTIHMFIKKLPISPINSPIIYIFAEQTVSILACCVYMLVASVINVDYGCAGILMIYILYKLPHIPILATLMSTFVLSVIIADPIQLASLLCIIPITFYNGQKGSTGNRYLFYIFYPAHLLTLTALAHLLGVL